MKSFILWAVLLVSCGKCQDRFPGYIPRSHFPIVWTGTPNYEGNSITEGAGASDAAHRYVNLVSTATGTSINNTGISGSSVRDVIYRRFVNAETVNTTQPLSVLIGTNDLRNSSNANRITKVAEGLRTVIANHFLESFTAINHASITRTGTWSSLEPYESTISSKAAAKSLGHPYMSNVAGSKLTFTHSGTNLVVGTWGIDGSYDYGSFQVKVDGVIKGTYDANDKADDWYYAAISSWAPVMPNVFIITGLGLGNHLVEIEVLENKEIDFDYVGRLGNPATQKACLIAHILKSSDYTYGGIYSSDAVVNTANAAIDEVYTYFYNLGYPIGLVRTENFFNVANTSDGLHPNDTGHAQVADAYLDVIP